MVPETAALRVAPGTRPARGAAECADAILIATEWPQFLSLDLHRVRERMRGRLLVDGRNLFDPERVRAAGLEYVARAPLVGARAAAARIAGRGRSDQ